MVVYTVLAFGSTGGCEDPLLPEVSSPEPMSGTVRLLYAYPADREFNQIFSDSIQAALENVQGWYREQLDGATFRIHDSVPEVCALAEPEAWYAAAAWARTLEGVNACAPVEEGSGQFVWVVYTDVDEPCPAPFELGRAWDGLAMLGRWDLLGLTDRAFVHCGWGPLPLGRWHGGLAHELAHAFLVPHPPGCDAGLPTCDRDRLMAAGYVAYPDTYLGDDEKAILLGSPFISRP